VTDWANFSGRPATNPKYCYEWSFVEPGKVVVLNLWHKEMEEIGGAVVQRINMRERASMAYQGKSVWTKRALKMDTAFKNALDEKLPVRVIVCDGDKRDAYDPTAKASKVTKRLLDPISWAITNYDWKTGACTLTRGGVYANYVDQFEISEQVEKRLSITSTFPRSASVRQAVLARAKGTCEYCKQPGFKMTDGSVFLETHHVVPLSEGGSDSTANVAALCPNHHREAHHGESREIIRKFLLTYLESQKA